MKKIIKILSCLLFLAGSIHATDRDSTHGISMDSKWNLALGADYLLANKTYPTVWADLYAYVIGFRIGYGPILNFLHSDFNNRFRIGWNSPMSFLTRIVVRIKQEDSFFRFLVFDPTITVYRHYLTILGDESFEYSFSTISLRTCLASRGFELYIQPQFLLSKDKDLSLTPGDCLIAMGLNYRFMLSKN
jgi:hypothetical protein